LPQTARKSTSKFSDVVAAKNNKKMSLINLIFQQKFLTLEIFGLIIVINFRPLENYFSQYKNFDGF